MGASTPPELSRPCEHVADNDLRPFQIEPLADAGGKLKGDFARRLAAFGDDERFAAFIEVAEPGYIPATAELRAAVSPRLFTADVRKGDLERLQRDPRVRSIEPTERLGSN